MFLKFTIGLLVSGILAAAVSGPVETAIRTWRANQLATMLVTLSQAASSYARMNCPGIVYAGTTPESCAPTSWPTNWGEVTAAGILPAGIIKGSQVLSPIDQNPISVRSSGGNSGIISVSVSNPGIGQMVANRLPLATYSGGIVTVPVLLSGKMGIWAQSDVGIINTNSP